MWPFDDEDENQPALGAPAPTVADSEPLAPASMAPQPLNPQVKDYLTQKYGLDQYSVDKRKEIEAQNAKDAEGPNWLAAMAALGAGLQGGNAAQAGANFLNMQNQQRQSKLDAFDKNRALAMQDLNEKQMLAKSERENDPNSPESKAAQELAAKMGVKPEVLQNLTAAKFKELAPTLSKSYQIDQTAQMRKDQLAQAKDEKQRDRDLKLQIAQLNSDKKSLLTPGQQALDKNFAKEYDDWTKTGEATVDKNLQRLEEAKQKLKDSKDDLVGYSGLQGRLPNILRSESSKTIQQDVQAAAQGSLRATLGPQFTEKEGERIMNMAYDPTLSPQANIDKIDLAIQEIKAQKLAQNAKAGYFEKNGTLAGFSKNDIPKPEGSEKKVVKKFRSPSTGKTKLVYEDGTSQIVDEAVANNGQ